MQTLISVSFERKPAPKALGSSEHIVGYNYAWLLCSTAKEMTRSHSLWYFILEPLCSCVLLDFPRPLGCPSSALWLGVGCRMGLRCFGPLGMFWWLPRRLRVWVMAWPGLWERKQFNSDSLSRRTFVSMVTSHPSVLVEAGFSHLHWSLLDPGWPRWEHTEMMDFMHLVERLPHAFLLMSVTGPFPWETFSCCVLRAVLRFGNTLCKHANSFQLCLTLCDPTDCNLPGSSDHGILQARILEWFAMPSSRGSSQPRDQEVLPFCF